MTDFVFPLCLPWPGEVVEAGQEVTVLGWGKVSDTTGGISSALQYLQVQAVSNEDCNAVFGVITEGNGCIEGPSTCNVTSCLLLISPHLTNNICHRETQVVPS